MNDIILFFFDLIDKFGTVILVPVIIFVTVTLGSLWLFYEKCNQPGFTALVPFWNAAAFMKIVGRPDWHSFYVIIPPVLALYIFVSFDYNLATQLSLLLIGISWLSFVAKILIEVCQSFGKRKTTDYILMLVFNGLYILNLGLSLDEKYKGPIYQEKEGEKRLRKVSATSIKH